MKLNVELIQYIETLVKTARSVGIEDLIIEPDLIRGMDEDQTIVLFHSTDVPVLPFTSIGLSRISTFLKVLRELKSILIR